MRFVIHINLGSDGGAVTGGVVFAGPHFYKRGFNSTERDAVMKEKHPDNFVPNTSWDPRHGEAGLDAFAEWRGDSRGWNLTDPWAERYLDKCRELGVTNIHVHKGPMIWPRGAPA